MRGHLCLNNSIYMNIVVTHIIVFYEYRCGTYHSVYMNTGGAHIVFLL